MILIYNNKNKITRNNNNPFKKILTNKDNFIVQKIFLTNNYSKNKNNKMKLKR